MQHEHPTPVIVPRPPNTAAINPETDLPALVDGWPWETPLTADLTAYANIDKPHHHHHRPFNATATAALHGIPTLLDDVHGPLILTGPTNEDLHVTGVDLTAADQLLGTDLRHRRIIGQKRLPLKIPTT